MKKEEKKSACIYILVVLLISSWIIIPNLGKGIDENSYCLRKLNKHFPEYNFVEAKYWESTNDYNEEHSQSCKGVYYIKVKEKLEHRDGLKEIGEKGIEQVKFFKLTDQRDIDYMRSDNLSILLIWLGFMVLFVGLIIGYKVYGE